jgi:hypothetical protein
MNGREEKLDNDLFYVCSLVEYIGRKTHNRRSFVVNKLGTAELSHLLELADIYHCEPIEATAHELIEKHGISIGDYDNISLCQYNVPTVFDIAKVYKRIILAIATAMELPIIHTLMILYNSWLSDKIEDYNSSMYFENPQYIFESFMQGTAIA